MLGLFLIYFIGKKFYDLAGFNFKSKLGYALFGVAAYYVGTFMGAIILAIGSEVFEIASIDESNEIFIGLLAIPFGLLACWGVYNLLERNWREHNFTQVSGVLDDGFGDDDFESRMALSHMKS